MIMPYMNTDIMMTCIWNSDLDEGIKQVLQNIIVSIEVSDRVIGRIEKFLERDDVGLCEMLVHSPDGLLSRISTLETSTANLIFRERQRNDKET